mmetsp:Transcript_137028/g.382055  ORF Transcript_137028/g.382055 Transcript_137028/m.382055 type:complete len:269 (-) Transcript_137028:246-1052(-)
MGHPPRAFLALLALGSSHCTFAAVHHAALDDTTALVQRTLRVKRRGRLRRSPENLVSTSLMDMLPAPGSFDCSSNPMLCKPPFSCNSIDAQDVRRWHDEGAAGSGTPNYRLWCALPHYAEYAAQCIAGELDVAGRGQYQRTASGKYGAETQELDASYCFIDGHCANEAVTGNTTVEEAVQLCDARFGRAAWATWGSGATPAEDRLGYELPQNPANGYDNQAQTRPSVLAACAMGNYHCDVRYCRESYCKDAYYQQKYGHFLEDYGWVS